MKDSAVGDAYMQKTFYQLNEILALGHGEEGDPGEPLKFKIYRGLPRYPLKQALPFSIGDPRRAFATMSVRAAATTLARQQGCPPLDFETLSSLLYFSFGFSRHDSGSRVMWPFHRLVASARCFYPSELYLWIPATGPLPAGIYHYDTLHHSLVCLRAGDYRQIISALSGTDLHGCAAVLFVSAHFWKNAFRYRNFSYRLCSQEAGMVSENARLVAETLGLPAQVHYQFLDQAARRLLGFQEQEESLFALLALGSTPGQGQPMDVGVADLLEQIEAIEPEHIQLGRLDPGLCSLLVEVDEHSFLAHTAEFTTETPLLALTCDERDERLWPPAPAQQPLELVEALRQRNSGDMFFAPVLSPLLPEIFWEIIRYSLSPCPADVAGEGSALSIQLYLAINAVEGVPSGVYRLCAQCQGLHLIEQRDVRQDVLRIHSTVVVNCSTAHMVCYLVADYHAMARCYGTRAYRIMNMQAGIVAQRLSVMSAAFGLAARCSDSYDIARCETLLGLQEQSALPVFLVAIGSERPGSGGRYRHAIRF